VGRVLKNNRGFLNNSVPIQINFQTLLFTKRVLRMLVCLHKLFTMPRRNPGTIDWTKSLSRQMVLDDLENGVVSVDETDSAEDLYYLFYVHTDEFKREKVLFRQFRDCLRDHREQVKKRQEASQWEMAAFAHDNAIFPTRTHNDRGEKKFYLTPAYRLLAKDVGNKLHQLMTPSQLKASRPEYEEFSNKVFDGRIRQAIRRERMVNWRNDKREADEKKLNKRRQELAAKRQAEEDLMQI